MVMAASFFAMWVSMGVAMFMVMVAMSIVGDMTTIGSSFGFERQVDLFHGHVHAAQHFGKHVVGFNLQVIGLQLYGYMAVAQVVGRAHQVKGAAMFGAGADSQYLLRCGDDAHHGAIFGHQHITASHGLPMGQKDGQFAA